MSCVCSKHSAYLHNSQPMGDEQIQEKYTLSAPSYTLSSFVSQQCKHSRNPHTSCRERNLPSHCLFMSVGAQLELSRYLQVTFVFFILHLSQAFHARSRFPSEEGEVQESASVMCDERQRRVFDGRCAVLATLDFEHRCFGFWDPRLPLFRKVRLSICLERLRNLLNRCSNCHTKATGDERQPSTINEIGGKSGVGVVCHIRPSHTRRVTPRSFRRWVMAACPSCGREGMKRAARGKRKGTAGFLRPKVLLYGEHCTDEAEITAAFNDDLKQPVDAVLIFGTRLSIESFGEFVSQLCKVVRVSN